MESRHGNGPPDAWTRVAQVAWLAMLLGVMAVPAWGQVPGDWTPSRLEAAAMLSTSGPAQQARLPMREGRLHLAPVDVVADRRVDTAWLVVAGVAGSGVGALVGGLVGHQFEDAESWVPVGTVFGGVLGSGLGIPLGVHLANGRRGRYGLNAVVTAAAQVGFVTLGGVVMARGTSVAADALGASLMVLPPVGISIAIERASAR